MEPSLGNRKEYPKIILFGDSLTERSFDTATKGFGAVLQNYYARRADVMNRGISGYNTTWLMPHFKNIIRLLQAANSTPPLFFTIFLGANDAILPKFSQHVPLDQYEANLRFYVDTLLAHPMTKGTKIILITPPPINIQPPEEDEFDIPSVREALRPDATKDPGYLTYMNKKKYAEKVMEIAQSYKDNGDLVAGLDFWTAMINYGRTRGRETGIPDDDEKLPRSGVPGAVCFGDGVFLDGLHLGPLGYEVLSTELLSLVTNKWPELRKEAIPLQMPWWGDHPQAKDSEEAIARREADERNTIETGVIPSRWL